MTTESTSQELTEKERRENAQKKAETIKTSSHNVLDNLLDFYEHKHYKYLGYTTWEKCVEEEFDVSRSYSHKIKSAAKIKENIKGQLLGKKIVVSKLIALNVIKNQKDQIDAWSIAHKQKGKKTAAWLASFFKHYVVCKNIECDISKHPNNIFAPFYDLEVEDQKSAIDLFFKYFLEPEEAVEFVGEFKVAKNLGLDHKIFENGILVPLISLPIDEQKRTWNGFKKWCGKKIDVNSKDNLDTYIEFQKNEEPETIQKSITKIKSQKNDDPDKIQKIVVENFSSMPRHTRKELVECYIKIQNISSLKNLSNTINSTIKEKVEKETIAVQKRNRTEQ